ncbi:entericidin A/B family lipoprotein [Altererythrobacter salegens]|uniref:Entericidin A/B family lipoprotein n=1 Tax=Croceibacterium salegens TaxID=1737568 RepID=A0A6I4STC6_9SPHN|nr:entericidin A/B family lipoprotein [Croceibacterium salegens]MXO58618.1 entericidin A/B family lipoprotein [Croceibacterium salegens]
MVKKLVVVLLAGAVCMTATACNTVKGLGRDIESVGEAGDRAI